MVIGTAVEEFVIMDGRAEELPGIAVVSFPNGTVELPTGMAAIGGAGPLTILSDVVAGGGPPEAGYEDPGEGGGVVGGVVSGWVYVVPSMIS